MSAPSPLAGPTASMLTTKPTLRQRFVAQLARLRPGPAHLLDAAFAASLVALALVGFRTTFFGLGWLWVGLAGLVVGLVISHVTATFRLPGIVTALLVVVAYLLLGGAIATRGDLLIGFVPSGSTVTELVHLAVPGWKELLTALPPVDSQGAYLALPFLFGLVGAALVYGVARRWTGALPALVAPVGLLAVSIALGTLTSASVALQGAVFALLAIGWAALRSNRNRPALQNGAGATTRAVTTAILLGVATVGGFLAGPHLPGADAAGRTVLRTGLVPPYDVTQFPSPLAGFRQYTEPSNAKLWDKTLLTVQGLPAGTPLRFAALDHYDGYVWGAGNVADLGNGDEGSGFRTVGRHIAASAPGQPVSATVTVPADGYGDVWVPTFGTVTGLEFAGARSQALDDDLRFNIDTNTAVLPTTLTPGDSYTVSGILPGPVAANNTATDSGSLEGVDTEELNFLSAKVDAWTGRVDGSWQKVMAIATTMQAGAYTDGGVAGTYQNKFLAGHGLRRMDQFMNSTQLAGNDEQYASALALAANRVGVPTRVVLGAIPAQAGAVKGKDVHAWVEVRMADGSWRAILPSQFLPDRTKKPQQMVTKSQEKKVGVQVPPPAANNPPSVLQGPDQAQNATQLKAPSKDDETSPLDPSTWPDWLRWIAFFVVAPLLLLLVVYGLIRMVKALRRYRRRTYGGTAHRVSSGWREVVDTARDLRMPLPIKGTRTEQARSLEEHVYGPPPEPVSPVVDGALIGAPTPSSGHEPGMVGPSHPSSGHEPGMVGPSHPSSGHEPGMLPTGDERERVDLRLATLATSADAHVFDIAEPTPEQVAAFWADVATARQAIRRQRGFWKRVRGDLSLRTFADRQAHRVALAEARAADVAARRTARRQPAFSTRQVEPSRAGIGTLAPSTGPDAGPLPDSIWAARVSEQPAGGPGANQAPTADGHSGIRSDADTPQANQPGLSHRPDDGDHDWPDWLEPGSKKGRS